MMRDSMIAEIVRSDKGSATPVKWATDSTMIGQGFIRPPEIKWYRGTRRVRIADIRGRPQEITVNTINGATAME